MTVAGYVLDVVVCTLGGNLIARDKTSIGLIEVACIVGSDLVCTSHIGIETNLLDEALEVLVLSVFPIFTVTLCITQRCISTYQELLIQCIVTVCQNILGNGLLKLTVDITTCLTTLNIVHDSEVLPSTSSKIYVSKSVVGRSAVCIGV